MTRPLFRFDPGWLFVIAGLAVCAAGLVLPAQHDLQSLQTQLDQLKAEETKANARLKAHSDFIDQVDRADPGLIRRLAATQLNLMPEGETPILLASTQPSPVTHWIESGVKLDLRPPSTPTDSILSRLANGPHRLWMFAAGALSVFIGILLAPISIRTPQRESSVRALEHELVAAPAEVGLAAATAVIESPATIEPCAQDDLLTETAEDQSDSHSTLTQEIEELNTLAAIEASDVMPCENLSEEEFAAVLDKVAADLQALDEQVQQAYEVNASAVEGVEIGDSEVDGEVVESDEEPESVPDIETDATFMIDPRNRMNVSEDTEES